MLSWIISYLSSSMKYFCEKMQDVYNLLTVDPVSYRGGELWEMTMKIFMALLGIGFTIIMISGYLGIFGNLETIYAARKPEVLLSLFGTVTICGGLMTAAPDILLLIVKFCQGIVKKATGGSFVFADAFTIPNSVINATQGLDTTQSVLFWMVCLIGSLVIMFTTFTILLMSYGRIFKMYLYIAIVPIALPCFASKVTQRIAINYIKTFLVTCMEGLVIIVAFMLFAAFNGSYGKSSTELSAEQEAEVAQIMEEEGCTREEAVDVVLMDEKLDDVVNNVTAWTYQREDEASKTVWIYVAEQSFLFLLLASIIKGSERETQKIFGL